LFIPFFVYVVILSPCLSTSFHTLYLLNANQPTTKSITQNN
jgi:hypothetical protein